MKHTLHIAGLLCIWSACGEMGKEPSTLAPPQVLGARANPRTVSYGTTVELEAITHGVETLQWFVCFGPYIPDGDPRCATEPEFAELELGVGASMPLAIPDASTFESSGVDVPAIYVRMLASGEEGQQTSVATIPFAQEGTHPEIDAFLDENNEAPATNVLVESTFALKPQLVVSDGAEDVLITWFVEGGEADPFRTRNAEETTITSSAAPGPMRVIAVIRDDNFGVGWYETTFTVTAP
ncbi:MAG: hypothetical protein VX223_12885 [Myxococcota bacterium]|nr:hypothetical protein [Myxococcota bacterium]